MSGLHPLSQVAPPGLINARFPSVIIISRNRHSRKGTEPPPTTTVSASSCFSSADSRTHLL
eukprot:scaffold9391_cov39-Cyclotella_meneghiniana.AAC.2